LVTAIHAAAAGLSAIVVDRGAIPHDKACGEGIMPRGVETLRALGIEWAPADAAAFAGVRFVDGDTVAEATFARGHGLGMRRSTLTRALVTRAEHLGITLLGHCEARAWTNRPDEVTVDTTQGRLHARWLAAADGLHSRMRSLARLALPARGRQRFGMRRHFAIAPWSPFVEVHWADGAEAYVTPTAPDEVGVAILWGGGGRFEERLRGFPRLHARLADARPLDAVRGAGPLRQRVRRRHSGRMALVGDAAGFVDAIAGEGLTVGFRTAAALVETIAGGRPLSAYERDYRRITRDYMLVTRMLLVIAARPWLRRRTVAALARSRPAFDRLVAVASGELGLHEFGARRLVRLGRDFVRARPIAAPPREIGRTFRA
jgi:flavin-dependent dehydrogenase